VAVQNPAIFPESIFHGARSEFLSTPLTYGVETLPREIRLWSAIGGDDGRFSRKPPWCEKEIKLKLRFPMAGNARVPAQRLTQSRAQGQKGWHKEISSSQPAT
jgi:hypothetical protein